MDRAEHTATKDGVDLQLTPTEFELLYVLAAHAGEALILAISSTTSNGLDT